MRPGRIFLWKEKRKRRPDVKTKARLKKPERKVQKSTNQRFYMRYWLLKSEPSSYSIEDMARDRTTAWNGVRNFQARNFMRDQMRVGDRAFFYHSNCDQPGIVGIVEVCGPAHADETQFDRKSKYYDPDAERAAPRWVNVDVKFVKKTRPVSLDELRRHKALARMRILQRGNRLSITPVDPDEWKFIMKLVGRDD
jgi:predicted RNA-binding protein with PUA-like domain